METNLTNISKEDIFLTRVFLLSGAMSVFYAQTCTARVGVYQATMFVPVQSCHRPRQQYVFGLLTLARMKSVENFFTVYLCFRLAP